MRRRGDLVAVLAEQALEPLLPQREEAHLDPVVRSCEHRAELAHRDLLLLFVPRDRVGLPGEVGLQLLVRAQELESLVVERGGRRLVDLAELLPVAVVVEDRKLRLCRAQRHLLALERHARGEDGVLKLVVALGELGRNEPALARFAQPVQPLALIGLHALLLFLQRAQLVAAEEVGVARDDRGLLRDLFLPNANRAPLLGALVEVPLDLFLELRRRADGRRRHRGDSIHREPRLGPDPFTT